MFLDFITENWLPILVVLGVLSYTVYLSITKQWTSIREFAYAMMLLAERTFGDKDGKIKFNFVVNLVYRNLPALIKPFVKEEDIAKMIQTLYDTAKDFLDDGVINSSVKK